MFYFHSPLLLSLSIASLAWLYWTGYYNCPWIYAEIYLCYKRYIHYGCFDIIFTNLWARDSCWQPPEWTSGNCFYFCYFQVFQIILLLNQVFVFYINHKYDYLLNETHLWILKKEIGSYPSWFFFFRFLKNLGFQLRTRD